MSDVDDDDVRENKRDNDDESTSEARKRKMERRKSRFEPHRSDSEEESENEEEEKKSEESTKEEKFDDESDSDESETEPFVKQKGMVITSFKNRLHDVRPGVPFLPSDRFVTKERKVSDLNDGGALQRDLDRMENGLYVPRKPEVTRSNLNARGHRDLRDGVLIELPSHPLESRGRVTLLEDTDEEDEDDVHCKVVSRKLHRSKVPISTTGGITVAHADAVLVCLFLRLELCKTHFLNTHTTRYSN